MADLPYTKQSQVITITGADSTGLETNVVDASANGELTVSDISDNGGDQAALTVGTSAVELKVGASALANRKACTFIHTSGNGKIYWGHTSSVTTANGTPITKNALYEWPCGPGTSIYLISDTAAQSGRITERA